MYALQHPRTCTLHTNRVFTTFVLSHHSHSSASWHTLSPSTLVTPDVGPPWPLRSRRLRSPRRSSRTQPLSVPRLSPSTLVTPDVGPPWPLRSRRLRLPRRSSRTQPHALLDHYLAPSNSLGHDVDFTWPRATCSAMPPLLPATSMQLAQPPLRDRSASATSPASSSIRQPSRSTSLDLEQLAQYPIQPSAANSLRHRNDTASSVVSFLQLRTPHPLAHRLSSQNLHRSPQARTLGQHAWDKPAARVASTAGTDHLNTLSLEFAKFVTLWEFSDNSSWFLTLSTSYS